jgi:REP element-mobilizing transposase RayT
MTSSQNYIYIHATWTTKHRNSFFQDEQILQTIINHIETNAIKKRIIIDTIGGVDDHIHALIRLRSIMTLAKTVKLIKGESSWWIRRNIPGFEEFSWQVGYDARTIDLKNLTIVRNYIKNQKSHHAYFIL